MPIIQINPTDLYFSDKIQEMCLKKSKSFPKGCPNYNKKEGCPPQPLIDKIFDLTQPLYLIYTEFEIKNFAERMKTKHPEWTEKQCYCSRYWQGTARKQHKEELQTFSEQYPNSTINRCPEAHGINIHKLMLRTTKINLEWPPRNLSRIVSLGGKPISPK